MNDTAGVDRRELIKATICGTVLICVLSRAYASGGAPPRQLDRWAKDLLTLNRSLAAREIDVLGWQDRIEALNRSVPVADLTRYLDVDAVTRGFSYPGNLADHADPHLPAEVVAAVGPIGRPWFVRIFGVRKGGAIIPHVHNSMVSAHLVINGSFRVRTHDRLEDLADAVVLRPTRDVVCRTGDILSMSEARDNQHWLVALEDRSMTFDVGMLDVAPAHSVAKIPANEYHMIFVDADRPGQSDGLVVAPVMTFAACARKYANWIA